MHRVCHVSNYFGCRCANVNVEVFTFVALQVAIDSGTSLNAPSTFTKSGPDRNGPQSPRYSLCSCSFYYDAALIHYLEPAFYSADAGRLEIDEYDQDLIISGEEPFEPDATDKPVRFLTSFTIFDPRHHSEMVSLVELEEVDATKDRDFVATGFVSAFVEGDDEDEGEVEENEADMPFVRLGSLFRYYVDAENE